MLVILRSPILELQHAPLPPSVASEGMCLDSLLFHYFHFRLTLESIKELGSMSFNDLNSFCKV